MGRKTLEAVFLALNFVACLSLPQQHHRAIFSNVENPTPFIVGEGVVQADLKIKHSSHEKEKLDRIEPNYTPYNKPIDEERAKSENDPVDFESADELDEPDKLTEEISPSSSNKRTTVRLPSGGAVNVASANPIYITIPIYINKAEGQPLRLSVGGQDIPLGPKPVSKNTSTEPLSPTSQFNRLLKHDTVQTKHTKSPARKTSKKKKQRHSSARLSSRKSHHSHLEESRKTEELEDSNPSVYYRFYF